MRNKLLRDVNTATDSRAQIEIYSDIDELCRSAVDTFTRLSKEVLSKKAVFTVALSGGSTPQRFHSLLAQKKNQSRIEWNRIHIFFSDERCVPPDHKESNYRAAYENLISKVPLPPMNVHRMPAEKKDLKTRAFEYESKMREVFCVPKGTIPSFDVIFLGLGEDGHTASLFPGTEALNEKERWVVENYVAQSGMWRMTFTLPLINQASCVIFLVSGTGKTKILNQIFDRKDQSEQLPAGLVKPSGGQLVWFVDQEAIGR